MASIRARAIQFLIGLMLPRQLPETEDALRKQITRTPGDPPKDILRRMKIDVASHGAHRVVTVAQRAGPVRGRLLYVHGGGYVHRLAPLHWRFIARLATELGVECTVPLYPLAPEHSCDEGIAFVAEVYRDLLAAHGAEHLLVMGDSAGGGLAVAMLQQVEVQPAGLLLNAPWLDGGVSDASQVALERTDRMLNRFVLSTWAKWWGGGRSLADPRVSPLFGDLTHLPRTLIFCGSADILVADARRFAEATGVRTTYVEEEGMMHVYPLLPLFPETARAWREIHAFVDETLQ